LMRIFLNDLRAVGGAGWRTVPKRTLNYLALNFFKALYKSFCLQN
jgi:hypothetical protein